MKIQKIINSQASFMSLEMWQTDSGLNILFGIEAGMEHLSISHKYRDPTWDEIKTIRYKMLNAKKTYGILLPPKEQYVNIDQHCFHLWEIKNT